MRRIRNLANVKFKQRKLDRNARSVSAIRDAAIQRKLLKSSKLKNNNFLLRYEDVSHVKFIILQNIKLFHKMTNDTINK